MEIARRRLGFLALFTFALFGALVARLWFLQIMEAPSFEQVASTNRTREIVTEAPRGQIFDAKGRLLAGRRESLVVVLDWTELRELESEQQLEIFAEVADELNDQGIKVKIDELERRYRAAADGSLKPVVIAEDVGQQIWITIQELDLTGFHVERRWIRIYPYGDIGAHIVGYTGSVSNGQRAAELNAANDSKIYFAGDEIGLAGVESLFESTLRGTPEIRKVEIDAENRVIGTVEVLQPSVVGQDLHLAIDIDLQYAAEQILADELRLARRRDACKGCEPHVAEAGSLVAIDVTDGSVVALASHPTYDPSDFVFGIGADQFSYLRDRPDQPFLDRATRGLYPPGSTFKPVTAYAALESGARGEYQVWLDEGVHIIDNCDADNSAAGCKFSNAGDVRYGPVDLRKALEVSSDTYFYSLGEMFWVNQDQFGETIVQETAEQFGFGNPTGIQLPSENAGRVPTPENRKEEFGQDRGWFTGDNVNLSIGQGDLVVTPLQLANSYAMLATSGTRYQPRLVDSITDGRTGKTDREFLSRVATEEPLDAASLAPIHAGLLAVPRSGTATAAFTGFPLDAYPIAGKTGTAQVVPKADFSLFAGYGPWPRPKYAVAAVLEEAGFGGEAAGPAVRRFFDLLAGHVPTPAAPLSGEPDVEFVRPFIPDGPAIAADPDAETTEGAGQDGGAGTDGSGAGGDASAGGQDGDGNSDGSNDQPTTTTSTPATSSTDSPEDTTVAPTESTDPTSTTVTPAPETTTNAPTTTERPADEEGAVGAIVGRFFQ